MDGTMYLQMIAFQEGRLEGCRVHAPNGERVSCCCEHAGCCGCDCPAHEYIGRECTCTCDHSEEWWR